jgi:pimeloyl-ACP methyl ester carboxylesterase
MKNWLICLLLTTAMVKTKAQELPRRSFLGTRLERVTSDLQRIMELPDTSGALVSDVIPGSTAQAAGLKKGDILLQIDGRQIHTPAEAVAYVGSRQSNTKFTYDFIRNKKRLHGSATFKPYPVESYKDLDVIYTQAQTEMGLQRLIITTPKTKTNLPIVVFIGGIGCYSLDAPFDTARSETQLLNKLARAGFTTVRIEKPGVGDAAGHSKACNEIGFMEEADGYVTAINDIRKRPGFGNEHVYIIGHSMGGVMAPLVAAHTEISGIIAYGTIGSNFLEYLMKTRRTIAEAYGWSPEETDDYTKDACECASYYFAEKQTTEQAAMKKGVCGEYLPVFDLRSRQYNDELYALNIPAAWKGFKGKALLAWGTSDFISSEEDHKIITDAVNYYHNGNASFVTIHNTAHDMGFAASFKEALTNPGAYNPEIGNVFLEWLKKQS